MLGLSKILAYYMWMRTCKVRTVASGFDGVTGSTKGSMMASFVCVKSDFRPKVINNKKKKKLNNYRSNKVKKITRFGPKIAPWAREEG